MRTVVRNVVLIGLALATLALGVSAALAPVKADSPVVNWLRAGQAPENTVLPLAANRPLSLEASVSCTTLCSLDPSGGTALRTQPERDLSA